MFKDEIAIPSILKIERGVTAHIGDYMKDADITQVTILPFRKRPDLHVRRHGI